MEDEEKPDCHFCRAGSREQQNTEVMATRTFSIHIVSDAVYAVYMIAIRSFLRILADEEVLLREPSLEIVTNSLSVVPHHESEEQAAPASG